MLNVLAVAAVTALEPDFRAAALVLSCPAVTCVELGAVELVVTL